MKLDYCTLIELKNRRLECLEELVRLADEMGKIDTTLADRNSSGDQQGLPQPNFALVS